MVEEAVVRSDGTEQHHFYFNQMEFLKPAPQDRPATMAAPDGQETQPPSPHII